MLDWLRRTFGEQVEVPAGDMERIPAVEAAEAHLAEGRAEEALAALPDDLPESKGVLSRYLHVKIRAALLLRDLLCLDGLARHAELLGELFPEKAKDLMLEAEAVGAFPLSLALLDGLERSGNPEPEHRARVTEEKKHAVMVGDQLEVAARALGDAYCDHRLVGIGRTSFVTSAVRRADGLRVAVKFLDPRVYADEKAQDRFMREAAILCQLVHPSILRFLDFDLEEPPYIVTEFFPGMDLGSLLQQGRRLKPREVAFLGVQLCEAVAYAHANGVVHRSVQPSNVLVNRQGRIRLIDLGTARQGAGWDITTEGFVQGDWKYLPPELFEGRKLDTSEKLDVFGVGATLYHMITGEPPFERGGMLRTRKPPLDLSAQGSLDALEVAVNTALADDPTERWSTVNEIRGRLATLLG